MAQLKAIMQNQNLAQATDTQPDYQRPAAVCERFKIARSTLWAWTKGRQQEGFPQPVKAGAKVTLFDCAAIERFIKAQVR